jgi:molybdopterin-binding protein
VLELASISKRFGKFQLSDVSLSLRPQEYFVLLGPSGVGKTVLLEIIAGLQRADSGDVRWQGQCIDALPPERRNFALVYQDYALFPHLTVLQNVCYGLRARGMAAEAARKRAQDMIELLGVSSLLDRFPERLSGGEKQRVALARALVTEPPVLLLDEPLAALDVTVRARLRHLLKDLQHQRGTTFLHVTHDVDEALHLGQRIGVLLGGKLQCVGTAEEIFQRPTDRAVAEFLGLQNVFNVQTFSAGVCGVHGVSIHLPENVSEVEHIWIRPEEILLSRTPFGSSARNQFCCQIAGWENRGGLFAVRVMIGDLPLVALITYASFQELKIEAGAEIHCTFKSTAIHCF